MVLSQTQISPNSGNSIKATLGLNGSKKSESAGLYIQSTVRRIVVGGIAVELPQH